MASSKKRFNTDLKETKEIEAPIDVMNIMLGYDGFDNISGHGIVPLIPTLFNSIKPQKLARLKDLLTAIVKGLPDEVKAILEQDPSLLLDKLEEKDCVTAPSGQRANNATAYRTALAVEDTQMAAMIKAKLIEVAGEDAVNTQYREQFPDRGRWEADEAKRWAKVFTQLDTLTHVIRYAATGDITYSGDPEYRLTVREGSAVAIALAQFRSHMSALLHEIVTTGRHFKPYLLLKAFKIYDDHYRDYFGNDWRNPSAILFWQQVIGTIQRSLPVNYVQAFCDGIGRTKNTLRNNDPQSRSLKVDVLNTGGKSIDFYPLSESRLGFDYAIDPGSGAGIGAASGGNIAVLFEAYVKQRSIEDSHHLAW